jgi:hypothetical protein
MPLLLLVKGVDTGMRRHDGRGQPMSLHQCRLVSRDQTRSVIALGGTPTGRESRDQTRSVIALGGTPTGRESRDQTKSALTVSSQPKAL